MSISSAYYFELHVRQNHASKAFDKVLHNGLYKKLLDRKALLCFALLLINWY